jgi:hypothetical protein
MLSKFFRSALFLFSLLACTNSVESTNRESGKLLISFKNASGIKLNRLIVADKEIGDIEAAHKSSYLIFEEFTFDTGYPDENASAVINGRLLSNHYRGFWCGTQKSTVDSGIYVISISVRDTSLVLSCVNSQ